MIARQSSKQVGPLKQFIPLQYINRKPICCILLNVFAPDANKKVQTDLLPYNCALHSSGMKSED